MGSRGGPLGGPSFLPAMQNQPGNTFSAGTRCSRDPLSAIRQVRPRTIPAICIRLTREGLRSIYVLGTRGSYLSLSLSLYRKLNATTRANSIFSPAAEEFHERARKRDSHLATRFLLSLSLSFARIPASKEAHRREFIFTFRLLTSLMYTRHGRGA